MRYFVITDSGQRYGPADLDTLNAWIREGRLVGTSMLQAENGGAVFAASLLPGLAFAPPAQAAGPPNFSQYPRGAGGLAKVDNGGSDVVASFAFAGLSMVMSLCGIFGLALAGAGIYIGRRAQRKGHALAVPAIVLNALAIIVWICARIFLHRL